MAAVSGNYDRQMRELVPVRSEDANKGSCGRLFIIAGSRGMTGAAALSAGAALRSGAGLVTVGLPQSEQRVLASRLVEAMTFPLPSHRGTLAKRAEKKVNERISAASAVVLGPGLGRSRGVSHIAGEVIKKCTAPLLIDADGINAICPNIDILKKAHCPVVLTPHPGEMARITGLSIEEIQKNREKYASEFSEMLNAVFVLKGKNTVIAAPTGEVFVNPTGGCALATGGTGDVLSGIIGAFLAQGLSTVDAARLGVYLHGRAGDIGAREKGVLSLVASDVIECLPEAFMSLGE